MKPLTALEFAPAMLASPAYFWNLTDPDELHMESNPGIEPLHAIVQSQHPKLFRTIMTTIPTMDGWCSVEKAVALAGLVITMKPMMCVEIGVWAGRSLLPMAWALKENGNGRVIGIDPYSAQESAKNEFAGNEEWWGKQDHEIIMKKFQSFVRNFSLESVVQLIRKPANDAEPVRTALLHIDGSHTEQAVKDAERFGAMVPVGGIVVLDDIAWVGGAVLRAIDTLEDMGFVERYRNTEQSWNIMQRVKS
ncbi:MAG: class I SAM-dependent methyltransferase [Solirubrobacterales bacterium]